MEGYAGSGHLAEYMAAHGCPVFAVDDCSYVGMKVQERHRGNVFYADVCDAFVHFKKMRLQLSAYIKDLQPYVMIITPDGDPEHFSRLLLAIADTDIPLILCARESFHTIAESDSLFTYEKRYKKCEVYKGEKMHPILEKQCPGFLSMVNRIDIIQGTTIRPYLCIYMNRKYTGRPE
ncbi:hypothetical protein CI610_02471 [invertebrate metagenome]|uniref:Uncharacterized protein n=1 Tax=invertebrate metagenome TaxID=1711999 RepID=A0A2H9T5W4_9ZZZZ